jgi:hypothetical protein
MPKSEYQKRKAAGQCVRAGCKRKPKLGPDGKPRSYCPVHNAANRKNSDAWVKRQIAKKRSHKKPRAVKPVEPVTA